MLNLSPPVANTEDDSLTEGLDQLPALKSAVTYSPYLTRLCRMRSETLICLQKTGGEACVRDTIAEVAALSPDLPPEDLRRRLRLAKADIHLSLASLDLACKWDWDPVTRAFSEFADAAVRAALNAACNQAAEAGWVIWEDRNAPLPGLFILALGKMGAHELNYSSDIDIVAMYDAETFPAGSRDAKEASRRIIQAMSQFLDTQTEHGYVLRVDLRLRPDPRSTSVAVSTQFAEGYYESVGQNWERMAYIKARPCAGDTAAAEVFLKAMEPFIWRRHMDFWALEDIRAIKQQIHATGGHQGLSNPEFDVKLGRGGIREIEFFAQTQQLIHGGRNPELRNRRTIDTLTALAGAGHIDQETADWLARAYARLRGVEHRIQMLNDDHTHTLSERDEQRTRVARLAGYSELSRFDEDISGLRNGVNARYSELFKEASPLSGVQGNLVFTGVDIDPGTVRTLSGLGFSDPERIIADIQGWHRGTIRATRTSRGRQLLTALEPRLFQHMAETGNPDAAYEGLKTFLGGLSAGIQTLSLLTANPVILSDLIDMFSMAPGLARDLANRPDLLESLLDGGFTDNILEDTCGHFEAISNVPFTPDIDFEGAMNEVRRNFRDAHFRIRFKLLNDIRTMDLAGKCFSGLADACIGALEPAALREVERTMGKAPGRWAVCGLGKLGSEDLTANSDLDLLVIFEPDGDQSATQFFTRATQRLITALSAQTEEGLLYEADMQLRPSGRAGPVAVRYSAYVDYYRKDAWTWERMAMTRLRPIAGNAALCRQIMAEKDAMLAMDRPASMICQDAWDMRQRLIAERPGRHDFDVKLSKGGMIDIEFLAQVVQLLRHDIDWSSRKLDDVIPLAKAASFFTEDEAGTLLTAYHHYRGILTYQRAALDKSRKSEDWPDRLKQLTSRALGYQSFEDLKARVSELEADVWAVFCKKLHPETTEWGG